MHDRAVHAVLVGAVTVFAAAGLVAIYPRQPGAVVMPAWMLAAVDSASSGQLALADPVSGEEEVNATPESAVTSAMPVDTTPVTGTEEVHTVITPETPPADTVPACPFKEAKGRTILDLTEGGTVSYHDLVLIANGAEEDARHSIRVDVAPGVYDVRLASFASPSEHAHAAYRERWRAEFSDAEGRVVQSSPSRDLADTETLVMETTDRGLVIPSRTVQLIVRHATVDPLPQSVVPLCVVLDVVGDIANEPTVAVDTLGDDVTASIESDPKAPLQVAPAQVGIESALKHITVANESVGAAREAATTVHGAPLFMTLARAGDTERAQIVHTLVVHEETADMSRLFARTIRDMQVSGHAEAVTEGLFEKRIGLVALRDTDGDGITDYDELYLYATDPSEPFTSGSMLTDGERLLLGLDPHGVGLLPVAVESPEGDGSVSDTLIVTGVTAVATDVVSVHGTTPPLSFVTIYLYPTQAVRTVRANRDGVFDCLFEASLGDGAYEVYGAITTGAGDIVVKSAGVPFEKYADTVLLASAVHTGSYAMGTPTGSTLSLLLLMLAAVGTMVWFGMYARHTAHDN